MFEQETQGAWVHSMEWSGQKDFTESPDAPILVDKAQAGVWKSHEALSFINLSDMVPMDQLKAALEMPRRFTKGNARKRFPKRSERQRFTPQCDRR
uniref:Uncharacterized protein n=1 Tax=Triticum urartu TaxID=4572 RepID=A0A8R7QN42_TRIUA